MAEGTFRADPVHLVAELIHLLEWPDFGPGHLPTSTSQGVESENILDLWHRLDGDHRSVLEETFRELPMSRFVWFENLLDHLKFHHGQPWMSGSRHLFRLLVFSSSPALFKLYLEILTTPGREPAGFKPRLYQSSISHNTWWLERNSWRNSVYSDTSPRIHSADTDITSDVEWLQLQNAVLELPLDISRMIQDSMYETVFGPKDVVLPWVDPNDLCHFSALNSDLYDKYHQIYYAKNMWVLADGPAEEIKLCLERMSQATRSAIRNVTLRWTREDIDEDEWSRFELGQFMRTQIDEGGAEGLDNMQALYSYEYARKNILEELKRIWLQKVRELRTLDLDLLVLDATTAYGPNEEYLGVEVAREMAQFYRNTPYRLEVYAPDEDLANEMFDLIVANME